MTNVPRGHTPRRGVSAQCALLLLAACGAEATEAKPAPEFGEPQYDRPLADVPRAVCADRDGDGVYASCEGEVLDTVDCDDADPTRSPGAQEVCDGHDNDCDDSSPDAATAACMLSCDKPPGGCETVTKLVAGYSHACVLTSLGRVLCWQADYDGSVAGRASYVAGIEGAEDVATSGNLTCARTGETATCWGGPSAEPFRVTVPLVGPVMGVGDDYVCSDAQDVAFACTSVPDGEDLPIVQAPYLSATSMVSGGAVVCLRDAESHQCYARRDDRELMDYERYESDGAASLSVGDVACWVQDAPGIVHCDAPDGEFPSEVEVAGTEGSVEVSRGFGIGCTLDATRTAHCWLGAEPPADTTYTQIATGHEFGCGIRDDNHVECWGAMVGRPLGYLSQYEPDATETTDGGVP